MNSTLPELTRPNQTRTEARTIAIRTFSYACAFFMVFALANCAAAKVQNDKQEETKAEETPMVAEYLYEARLSEGNKALKLHLESNPEDDQARFGLGFLQFMEAIEHLGQQIYSYGRNDETMNDWLPFVRLPVPDNPEPQEVAYADFRLALESILLMVEEAEQTLAKVSSDDVSLSLDLREIALDFDSNGKASKDEKLVRIIKEWFRVGSTRDYTVDFDKADVVWLRGYCHLVAALAEASLSVDMQPLWDVIAHRLFPKAIIKYDFLKTKTTGVENTFFGDQDAIMDFIAAIHNSNFEVIEPKRLKNSHQHLKTMIGLSRENWRLILAETDNQREWIPSPSQTGFIKPVVIQASMVETWHEFLDEWEAILDGKKLVPFWRGDNKKLGVNIKRVFEESKRFDVVLWIQGTGAGPFVEEGDVTSEETWNKFQVAFGGNFFGFAMWFN